MASYTQPPRTPARAAFVMTVLALVNWPCDAFAQRNTPLDESSGRSSLPQSPYEKIGVLAFGVHSFFQEKPLLGAQGVARLGYAITALMPVRVPVIDVYYQPKLSVNGATWVNNDTTDIKYVQASNALLLGKRISLRRIDIEILPQAGAAFKNGVMVGRIFSGGIRAFQTHYFWSWQCSLLVQRRFHVKDKPGTVGLLIDYTRAFVCDEDTKQHLTFSLATGY